MRRGKDGISRCRGAEVDAKGEVRKAEGQKVTSGHLHLAHHPKFSLCVSGSLVGWLLSVILKMETTFLFPVTLIQIITQKLY